MLLFTMNNIFFLSMTINIRFKYRDNKQFLTYNIFLIRKAQNEFEGEGAPQAFSKYAYAISIL